MSVTFLFRPSQARSITQDEHSETSTTTAPWQQGVDVIRLFCRDLPATPGVYQMLDGKGKVLYVGKARRLKNRIMSYTNATRLTTRIRRMVSRTRTMQVEHTHTDAEALLLEMNTIKQLKPPYNILLRDDKSFPFLRLDRSHDHPRLHVYRGRRTNKQKDIFGPFASANAVYTTLETLQKAFLLRVCSDHVFDHRKRPCLLHQIKRCSAPCVGEVSKEEYRALVDEAIRFFKGRNHEVQRSLAKSMEEASDAQQFERAALLRDRIRALTSVQGRQRISIDGLADADIIVCARDVNTIGIRVTFYRGGSHNGTRDHFQKCDEHVTMIEALVSYIAQLYSRHPPPALILTNIALSDASPDPTQLYEADADVINKRDLSEALSALAGNKVSVENPQRGRKKELIDFAVENLDQAMHKRRSQLADHHSIVSDLAQRLDLDTIPSRIEVYDNSHLQGAQAVGALIVVTPEGFSKSDYRRFIIRSQDITPGDDYGMMREVLTRRFSKGRPQKSTDDNDDANENDNEATTGSKWPDLVLLDGGPGQLAVGAEVFKKLGITDIALAGISKGPNRAKGEERIYTQGQHPLFFSGHDPLLFFLQSIRDEAHRFVLHFHRHRRSKAITSNPLDNIAGIGAKRKRALMHHFGSAKAITYAGIEDLQAVEGISSHIAQLIYHHFHS